MGILHNFSVERNKKLGYCHVGKKAELLQKKSFWHVISQELDQLLIKNDLVTFLQASSESGQNFRVFK